MEKVSIDVPMPIHYIRKDLVRELSLLEPFGKGNEKAAVCTEKSVDQSAACLWKKSECRKDASDR